MAEDSKHIQLSAVAPHLARILARSVIHTAPQFPISAIRCETLKVPMRDGTLLATDVYLPPVLPAPTIAVRTPYGRARDSFASVFFSFARRGYVVVSQDCRGTGDSEPEEWDYYMYEPEDGYDVVEWVSQQSWFNGFLGSCGGSYDGQTQWQMATHSRMSTIVPEVSGLGIAINTVRLHMFVNAHARSVGKGERRLSVPYFEVEQQLLKETLTTGYFNEPISKPLPQTVLRQFPHLRGVPPGQAQRWLWEHYCSLSCTDRAEFIRAATNVKSISVLEVESLSALFGHTISHDRHTLPYPRAEKIAQSLHAPVLLRTGWYDWALNDALATWELLMRAALEPIRSRCRLLIAPSAHNMPGYHEGMGERPELQHAHGVFTNVELLLYWFAAIRDAKTDTWPTIIYYLMGTNEWYTASAWPVPGARLTHLYLGASGTLSTRAPRQYAAPASYIYDPNDPTPTVGGSIVSYVYPPGSIDVSVAQRRPDVLMFTTQPLEQDVHVVGPLRLTLYASSSAVDTDFAARLSDVFPDGRAVQLQNGVLRARHRNIEGEPELLQPGRIYRFEVDMWATANCFKKGHRIRLDISSADFPRFDRNANRGGDVGSPVAALQTIYFDPVHPSQLLLPVLGGDII